MGLFKGILRSYDPKKSAYEPKFLVICFGVGTGTKQSLHLTLLSNSFDLVPEVVIFVIWGLNRSVLRSHDPPKFVFKAKFLDICFDVHTGTN